MKHTGIICAFLLFSSAVMAHGTLGPETPKPDLAPVPPMGWNSWNRFGHDITEDDVRRQADAMVTSGLKDAGYAYLVIDDSWQIGRDDNGRLLANPKTFPSGIKKLADYVHSKGLKLGIYSDAGVMTCGRKPGSAGYEFLDAQTFASWGVDYLKYDFCFTGSRDAEAAYALMAKALRESGRDIVFSICEWGQNRPQEWAPGLGHLWRTSYDIRNAWSGKLNNAPDSPMGVLDILDLQVDLWPWAGPNRWNDPDMLEIGNGVLTVAESESHFSLWAMLAAPLILGNDLSAMDRDTLRILTNADVIAVDQDSLGRQGRRIWKKGDLEIWSRPLAGGDLAVILFNRGADPARMEVAWEQLNLPEKMRVQVRDLWSKKITEDVSGRYGGTVASHGVIMVRLTPQV